MTDDTNTEKAIAGTLASLKRRIAAKRWLATLAILAERLWIALLPVLAILSLYLILSWFGLFRLMPDWLRIAIVAVSIILLAIGVVRLRNLSLPRHNQVHMRLETRSGISHQALRMLEDRPIRSDPFGAALWRAHLQRMTAQIGGIEAGFPSPDIARHDPYALRAGLVCMLVVSWGFSFSGAGGSLTDGFDPPKPKAGIVAVGRVDAWVTPPAYTGQAPIYLTGEKPVASGVISVPQYSELTLRLSGVDGAAVPAFYPDGGGEPIAFEDNSRPAKVKSPETPVLTAAAPNAETAHGYHLKLARDGKVDFAGRTYRFRLKPDLLPKIAFTKEPVATVNGALEISFTASDDYGVTRAHAEIIPLDADPGAVALFDLPEYRLDIPAGGKGETKATTSRDLTEHSLSGKKVRVTLVAADALGQTARSEPRDIIMPVRPFSQALAASVAEQRQVFSLDVRQIRRALELNEASTLRAEETIPNLTHYLLVRSVANRLKMAHDIGMLRETADYFWEVARGIEDGDMSVAEKNLKSAQKALSDALKRDAADEEIAKLMAELRKAMDAYIAELAKRSQTAGKQMPSQTARNVIRSQDLQKMLDQLENLARSGSREEAQKLLNDMQRLMNNLNTARPRDNQDQQNSPARDRMDRLGKIIQEQEKLMDETHRLEQALRDRQQRGEFSDPEDGPPGMEEPDEDGSMQQPDDGMQSDQEQPPGDNPQDEMTAEQLKQALKELKSRQETLEQSLGELQKKLGEMGMKPSLGFGDGKKEMKDAAGALGKSQGQRAVDSQARALEALRKGAGDMMRQMMQAQGRGQGHQPNRQGLGSQQDRDPLGRQSGPSARDEDNLVRVPGEIDIQRAREILDAIRRRLSEGTNSTIERNYLERLLNLAR